MRRATVLLLASSFALASCASVPTQTQLTAGINQNQLAQGAMVNREPTDPVCVEFYDNVDAFHRTAKKGPSGFESFLSVVGVSVAAAVVADEIVPKRIRSRTGRIAARTAAHTATSYGGHLLLRDIHSTKRADSKIISVAEELGCPIFFGP